MELVQYYENDENVNWRSTNITRKPTEFGTENIFSVIYLLAF